MLWLAPDDDNLSTHPRQYEFDYVNDELVQKHMRIQDGRIVLPSGASYQILYIAPAFISSAGIDRYSAPFTVPSAGMPLETLRKVRELVHEGATVVWEGSPPEQRPSLRNGRDDDNEYEAIVKELWNDDRLIKLQRHDYDRVTELLDQSADPPAWELARDVPIRIVHRQTEDADIFFVVNRGILDRYKNLRALLLAKEADTGISYEIFSEGETFEGEVVFRIRGRQPELWIPETGEIKTALYKSVGAGVAVKLELPAHHSVFVVFRKTRATDISSAVSRKSVVTDGIKRIEGPWRVEFPKGWGVPAEITLPELKSWTEMSDSNIRHFNGIATYSKSFSCERRMQEGLVTTLDLGRVAEICELWLNGQRLGVGWYPPYCFDITNQLVYGENDLKIRVTNVWHNRLVADAALPKEKRVTRMYPEKWYERFRGRKLVDCGLKGPVRIIFSKSN